MKPGRATLIATAVVTAFAAYSIYDFRKNAGPVTDAKGGEQKPLFNLVKEDVRKIKLTHGDVLVELQRRGDEWFVVKPLEDLAESGAVDAFLYSALSQKGKVFRSGDEGGGAIKWGEFGLDPGLGTVELEGRDGKQAVTISSVNAFDGSYYVRLGDELLLGDRGLAQITDRPAASFRSRSLWRTDHIPIQSIDVALDDDGIKLKYAFVVDGSHWKMQPDPGFPIDTDRVDHWIKRLQNLIPSEIVKDEITPALEREFLLLKPSYTVQLNLAGEKPSVWKLTIGQDRDQEVFLYSSVRPSIYKSGVTALRQIRVAPEFFRDGKQPFNFDMTVVAQLETQQPGVHHVYKKDGAAWSYAGADKSLTINQDRLMEFFQNLHALETGEFIGPTHPSFKPAQSVKLRDSKGQPVFELSWGGEFKSKRPRNVGVKLLIVKSSLSKDLFVLPPEKLSALFNESIVNVPAPKAAGAKAEK